VLRALYFGGHAKHSRSSKFLTACIVRGKAEIHALGARQKRSLGADLKVTTTYEQVDSFSTLRFEVSHGVVDLIKFSVTATFNRNLRQNRSVSGW